MKCEQFEPVLKPVMLNRICRSEYLKAKREFVRNNFEIICWAKNAEDVEIWRDIIELFKKKFYWQTHQTDKNIIVTVTNVYKKLYG